MIIKSIRVRNFRCIRDETLFCEKLTALVGPNASGKSSFLRALDIFYNPNAKYTEEDFYARDTSQNIVIIVTYTDLTEDEKKIFKKYLQGEDLSVEKELSFPISRSSQKYYGRILRNPDFKLFREASGRNLRTEYEKLRKMEKYSHLPRYTNREDAEKILSEWEQSHPNQCVWQRVETQFFGFKEVGGHNLEEYTKFILVPAVRDASEDAIERKGAVISEIMDLVVRSALAQRKEITQFKEHVKEQYKEIFDPSRLSELQELEESLSNILRIYIPDAQVNLRWQEREPEIPDPIADVRLVEDEYSSPVGYCGHGLQRAFILTMLQYLALTKFSSELKNEEDIKSHAKMPNLIIGIEEPELYQHPSRQRALSKVLRKLATEGIPGIVTQIQIIYSTHSPLFVDIEHADQIRIFRKKKAEKNKPKCTKIFHTNFQKIKKIIEKAYDKTFTTETIRLRLKTLMTPWLNEGFFARVVVLVEGQEDRAAIIGNAMTMNYDLESEGISVIPCRGKTRLYWPIAILKTLHIPVYAIWDSDYGSRNANPEENHRLLRLFGHKIEDWPEAITDNFACFKRNLMTTLKDELGEEVFNKTLNEVCEYYGITEKKRAIQNPVIMHEVLGKLKDQGKTCYTLDKIVCKILKLAKMENK